MIYDDVKCLVCTACITAASPTHFQGLLFHYLLHGFAALLIGKL